MRLTYTVIRKNRTQTTEQAGKPPVGAGKGLRKLATTYLKKKLRGKPDHPSPIVAVVATISMAGAGVDASRQRG